MIESILGCVVPEPAGMLHSPAASVAGAFIPGLGAAMAAVDFLSTQKNSTTGRRHPTPTARAPGDERMRGQIGSCNEKYYNKDDVSFATDYTLWQDEGRLIPESGMKSHGDADYTCTDIGDCYESYLPVGIGVGNAPRKYKECCDLSLDVYGKESEHSAFDPGRLPTTAPRGSTCGATEIFSGLSTLADCGENEIARGGVELGNFVASGVTDLFGTKNDSFFGEPEPDRCPGGVISGPTDAMEREQHLADKICRKNNIILHSGCEDYIGHSGSFTMDDDQPPDLDPNGTAKHAHNAIVQFKREHDICRTTDLTTLGEQELGTPPGDYTLGCNPLDRGYDEKVCLGNFRKAGIHEEIYHAIKIYFQKKKWQLLYRKWQLIKTFYKWVLGAFLFMWISLKIKESTTLKIITGIILYIYIWTSVKNHCQTKTTAPAFICSRIADEDSNEPAPAECTASKDEPWSRRLVVE